MTFQIINETELYQNLQNSPNFYGLSAVLGKFRPPRLRTKNVVRYNFLNIKNDTFRLKYFRDKRNTLLERPALQKFFDSNFTIFLRKYVFATLKYTKNMMIAHNYRYKLSWLQVTFWFLYLRFSWESWSTICIYTSIYFNFSWDFLNFS